MAFSPPVLGCLVKRGLQKGGSRAPQDPPGYALEYHVVPPPNEGKFSYDPSPDYSKIVTSLPSQIRYGGNPLSVTYFLGWSTPFLWTWIHAFIRKLKCHVTW